MDLGTLLTEETINLELKAETREEAITKLIVQMQKAGYIKDINNFQATVILRERLGSTGIGFGVAIPHGKSNSVLKPGLGFAKLTQPIEWQALDNKPVEMFFLIAIPEANSKDEHLKILAALSRKLIYEDFRNKLLAAYTSEEIITLIKSE